MERTKFPFAVRKPNRETIIISPRAFQKVYILRNGRISILVFPCNIFLNDNSSNLFRSSIIGVISLLMQYITLEGNGLRKVLG